MPRPGQKIDNTEALVGALNRRGVRILTGGSNSAPDPGDSGLIGALAASEEPRVRNSLAILLVVHPELDPDLMDALLVVDDASALELRSQHAAAVYLQRFWRTRLAMYLPDLATLPDRFTDNLGLPSPDDDFGKWGLLELSSRSGFNLFASYDHLMEELFGQLNRETHVEPASSG